MARKLFTAEEMLRFSDLCNKDRKIVVRIAVEGRLHVIGDTFHVVQLKTLEM